MITKKVLVSLIVCWRLKYLPFFLIVLAQSPTLDRNYIVVSPIKGNKKARGFGKTRSNKVLFPVYYTQGILQSILSFQFSQIMQCCGAGSNQLILPRFYSPPLFLG